MGDTFDETSQKINQLNNEIKEQRDKNMRLVMARAEEVKLPRNSDPQYSELKRRNEKLIQEKEKLQQEILALE